MITTRVLKTEHGLILRHLENLWLAQKHLEKGRRPAPEFFETAVGFSRDFADRFHHVKEEFVLFGVLAQKQNGRLDMEIGALRHQHECCRHSIVEIERALKGYRARDEIAATAVLTHLAAYTAILQRHICLEDTIFFPMADALLTSEDHRNVADYFDEEGQRMQGRSLWDKSRRQVDSMQEMLRR